MAYMCNKKAEVILLGGVGNKWGEQYHQQDRVYDRLGISPAVNASANNGGVIRKWYSESDRQQNKAT